MKARVASEPRGWLQTREVGSVWAIKLLLRVATSLGRWPLRALLRVIVLYYALTQPRARRASAEYLQRMKQPHGFWDVYRHLLRFAQCAADRPFLILGRHALFDVRRHGHEHLEALQRTRTGAILLGAHLGSFEAMGAQADREDLVMNVVGYFRNAAMLNRVLRELGGGVHTHLLEPSAGIDFPLKLRDCLERGELVAMLGDRSVDGKSLEVDFLGGRAHFPTGPFVLASVLRCPVLLTFGLHHPPNRYDLYCEPFAERIELPRGRREEALQQHIQRFATRLEHYCGLAPDNWFNFYDFWSTRGHLK